MGEFAPVGQGAKMTRNQVNRYIKNMEEKRAKAKLELENALLNGELGNDDLSDLEKQIDNL